MTRYKLWRNNLCRRAAAAGGNVFHQRLGGRCWRGRISQSDVEEENERSTDDDRPANCLSIDALNRRLFFFQNGSESVGAFFELFIGHRAVLTQLIVILRPHCITVILFFIVLFYFVSSFNMHMFIVLDFTSMQVVCTLYR